MGTDIHGVFQRYDATTKLWRDIESKYEQHRHYQLFAVLADVRNGYGFAGIPTGEAVTPISVPKGLPSDFEIAGDAHPIADIVFIDPSSREYHQKDDPLEIWMGDHSHSWLTGEEMLAWVETAPISLRDKLAYFFDEVARLGAEHGKIRFVFGFDS